MPKSQKQLILEYMQSGKRINKVSAQTLLGCWVLAARIDDIEADINNGKITGYRLCRQRVKEHNNACEYWLEPLPVQQELKFAC